MSHFYPVVPSDLDVLRSQRGYSPGVRTGNLLFVSGMLGRRPDLSIVEEPETQLIQMFDNLGLVLKEAQRRSGRRGRLSLRLRELGGLVRIAGDLASEEGADLVGAQHITRARAIAKPLEQQVADRYLERQSEYAMLVLSLIHI